MKKPYKLPRTEFKGWYLGTQYLYKSDTERVKIDRQDWRAIARAKPVCVNHICKLIFDSHKDAYEMLE